MGLRADLPTADRAGKFMPGSASDMAAACALSPRSRNAKRVSAASLDQAGNAAAIAGTLRGRGGCCCGC